MTIDLGLITAIVFLVFGTIWIVSLFFSIRDKARAEEIEREIEEIKRRYVEED